MARAYEHTFAISSFGANAITAARDQPLVVEHDETSFGNQEELYIVIEGQARFTCDGETVDASAASVVCCAAPVTRAATALETPTTILIVSGQPGQPFKPEL